MPPHDSTIHRLDQRIYRPVKENDLKVRKIFSVCDYSIIYSLGIFFELERVKKIEEFTACQQKVTREIPKDERYCVRVYINFLRFLFHIYLAELRKINEISFAPRKKNHVCVYLYVSRICTYSSLDVAFLVAVFQVKKMYTWNIYEAVCVFKNINKNTLRVSAHTYTHQSHGILGGVCRQPPHEKPSSDDDAFLQTHTRKFTSNPPHGI